MAEEIKLRLPEKFASLLAAEAESRRKSKEEYSLQIVEDHLNGIILTRLNHVYEKFCEVLFSQSSIAWLRNIPKRKELKIYDSQISLCVPLGRGNIAGLSATYFINGGEMRITFSLYVLDSWESQAFSEKFDSLDKETVKDVSFMAAYPGREFDLFVEEKLSMQDIEALNFGNLPEKIDRMAAVARRL